MMMVGMDSEVESDVLLRVHAWDLPERMKKKVRGQLPQALKLFTHALSVLV
jgi:hypothetical protein